ncbi:MAG: DotI/IcmL/TraM family protein [Pseudomonadota bacterium]
MRLRFIFPVIAVFMAFVTPATAQELQDLYSGPRNAEIVAGDTRRLSVPHRTDTQLSVWLEQVISQSLTYTHTNIQANYTAIAPNFTEAGLTAYRNYLQSSDMWRQMLTQKSTLQAITVDAPKLLNRGVVNDAYKWLYDIPVMVSLLPEGIDTLRKLRPQSYNLLIRVQLTRIADQQNNASITDAGPLVKIETWTVTQIGSSRTQR